MAVDRVEAIRSETVARWLAENREHYPHVPDEPTEGEGWFPSARFRAVAAAYLEAVMLLEDAQPALEVWPRDEIDVFVAVDRVEAIRRRNADQRWAKSGDPDVWFLLGLLDEARVERGALRSCLMELERKAKAYYDAKRDGPALREAMGLDKARRDARKVLGLLDGR